MRPGFLLFLFIGGSVIVWKFLFTMLSVKFADNPIGQAAALAL